MKTLRQFPGSIALTGGVPALASRSVESAASGSADPLIIAMLQMLPDGANQPANLIKADDFSRQAATKGTETALMP